MSDLQWLIDHCQSRPDAVLTFPFGPVPACFKVRGKIFAEIYPDPVDPRVTLRCEPEFGAFLRDQHEGSILPGYRVPLRQRRFKNTVLLDGRLPRETVLALVDHSYATLQ